MTAKYESRVLQLNPEKRVGRIEMNVVSIDWRFCGVYLTYGVRRPSFENTTPSTPFHFSGLIMNQDQTKTCLTSIETTQKETSETRVCPSENVTRLPSANFVAVIAMTCFAVLNFAS